MARQKKTPFPPWQTAKANGIEERYIRLGNSQLLSPALLLLTHSAFHVYVYMLLESGGKPTFEFPRSKFTKIVSNGGYQKVLTELIDAGFIEVEQRNGNLRKPNIYRFCEKWKTLQQNRPIWLYIVYLSTQRDVPMHEKLTGCPHRGMMQLQKGLASLYMNKIGG